MKEMQLNSRKGPVFLRYGGLPKGEVFPRDVFIDSERDAGRFFESAYITRENLSSCDVDEENPLRYLVPEDIGPEEYLMLLDYIKGKNQDEVEELLGDISSSDIRLPDFFIPHLLSSGKITIQTAERFFDDDDPIWQSCFLTIAAEKTEPAIPSKTIELSSSAVFFKEIKPEASSGYEELGRTYRSDPIKKNSAPRHESYGFRGRKPRNKTRIKRIDPRITDTLTRT